MARKRVVCLPWRVAEGVWDVFPGDWPEDTRYCLASAQAQRVGFRRLACRRVTSSPQLVARSCAICYPQRVAHGDMRYIPP